MRLLPSYLDWRWMPPPADPALLGKEVVMLGRLEETELNSVVLRILASQPNGRAPVRVIRQETPKYIRLTLGDKADSVTRRNEKLWEQQVRNLRSHQTSKGNVFYEGLVTTARRGVWELTGAGWAHIKKV